MNRSLALLIAAAVLSGCQTITPPATDTDAEAASNDTGKKTEQLYRPFSQETVYALLSAELAGQRNRYDIALDNYVTQAQITGDAGVAERGFHIAQYLGADQAALDTSLQWAISAPSSIDAQRAAAVQLARAGRYDESMAFMEKVLRQQGDTHFDFLAIAAAEADPDTRTGLLQSFERLLVKYPDNSQLKFAKAVLLQQNGESKDALNLLEQLPENDRPVAAILLQARLLQSLDRADDALSLLRTQINNNPDERRLRLSYARILVSEQRLDEAKSEFSALLQENPEDDDLRFSLALICLEDEAWQEAIAYLNELIDRDAHADAAHYNLGRAYEEMNNLTQALREYGLVGPGSEYIPAQVRRTALLFEQQRPDEAAQLLNQARGSQPDYAIQLYLIEADSWAQQQNTERAWQVLQTALAEFPDDLNLLYSRAMLAEKRDDLALLESDLRFILEREPDNAMVLNALGYTLADRTTRYEEAKQLIIQAHQLSPQDPAVLDSLGWVNFRLGNLSTAEHWLRQALKQMPDAEVAAHLGEVLWAQNKQAEARKVWADAYSQQPDNEILRNTLLRLTGTEKP